jgi:NTP pyrophosphatase (non-canonical NTP hydrolase)
MSEKTEREREYQTPLPGPGASLHEIQTDYMVKMLRERGINQEYNSEHAFIHLVEEIGEIARALRKLRGDKFAADTHQAELADELADAFIILCDLANCERIDLFDAFIAKEKVNRKRVWKKLKEEA